MAVTTYGNVASLEASLDSGANPQVRDESGKSPLDYARQALKTYGVSSWGPELDEIVEILEKRQ